MIFILLIFVAIYVIFGVLSKGEQVHPATTPYMPKYSTQYKYHPFKENEIAFFSSFFEECMGMDSAKLRVDADKLVHDKFYEFLDLFGERKNPLFTKEHPYSKEMEEELEYIVKIACEWFYYNLSPMLALQNGNYWVYHKNRQKHK